MRKKHVIPADHFMEQFHNHHHYAEYGPDERRPEWWELPEPRARGGRIDFHGRTPPATVERALKLTRRP